jgi:hypothetical protein
MLCRDKHTSLLTVLSGQRTFYNIDYYSQCYKNYFFLTNSGTGLAADIRLVSKYYLGTNTLAYLLRMSMTKKESFITLTLESKLIKLLLSC